MTSILGIPVNTTSYHDATVSVLDWSARQESRFVCLANVHMLMETYDSDKFRYLLKSADLVTPDGMPLVWMLRFKGHPDQQRVYGPTLMMNILQSAETEGIPVGFFGSSNDVIKLLVGRIQGQFPNLKIAYAFSPPFREPYAEEDGEFVRQINASSARILFVGLGCPKQEKWMAEHRGKVNAVMLGVGAAFDFHAGMIRQAPLWMQKMGLEWFYRFVAEPRRLWRRYLYHNPRFILLAVADLLGLFQ
jgi:N-acetylglucosaminyldiphosphoundecaprenol N-acetyl-beta-D-mannosaminyltransferase